MGADLDHELSGRLARLADSPLPPSPLDLPAALDRAQRAHVRRRINRAAGALAVLAAVSLGTTGVLDIAHKSGAVAPSTGSGVLAAGSDPLSFAEKFGWLPFRTETSGGAVYADGQQMISARDSGGDLIELTVYQAGQNVAESTLLPTEAQRVAASPVDGHAAYWAHPAKQAAQTGVAELIWRSASGGWDQLTFYVGMVDQTPDSATMYRIAEGVAAASREVPLPIELPQVDLPFYGASYSEGSVSGFSVLLMFGTGSPSGDLTAAGAGTLTVGLGWGDGQPGAPGATRTDPPYGFPQVSVSTYGPLQATLSVAGPTADPAGSMLPVQSSRVGGHDAAIVDADSLRYILAKGYLNGASVAVTASGTQAAAVDSAGGVAAYFRTFIVLGPDQTGWTTHVIG